MLQRMLNDMEIKMKISAQMTPHFCQPSLPLNIINFGVIGM